MTKPDGFLEWDRKTADRRPVEERVQDSRELYLQRSPETRRQQAGRCMDCGVPFCHQGCPLGNRIPDFNDSVFRGDWKRAWAVLKSTNNFPEFTGRLCPAPCEAACVLSINADPVTIEQIEQEIAERAWDEGWELPAPPRRDNGHSVGIVGSGPAGLAAAQQLRQAGYAVTVYEKSPHIGGLLRYGIPDFKLEKSVVERRVAQLEAEGIAFLTGMNVGESPTWTALKEAHDALLIATGAGKARDLQVPGRDLSGVHFAMTYLTASNQAVAGANLPDALSAAGKRVVVLGGGDTGSDCVGTAIRQGAASVHQIELMPASPTERPAHNPWPQWPLVFRSSHAHEEGVERAWSWMTTELEGRDGALTALKAAEVVMTDGRPTAGDRTERFEADLLLLAMGFTGPQTHTVASQLGVALNLRGAVDTTEFRTSVPGVYAAGDAQRGASLIVWAIADGREAARIIDADLMGHERLARKGQERSFGGR